MALRPLQAAPALRVEVELLAARIAVGDPVELGVRLHHAPGARFELSDSSFDYSWIVLERAGSTTVTDGPLSTTTYRLAVTSLEAGERELPTLLFRDSSGAPVATVQAASPPLSVTGLLAETEDAPRPIAGFQDPQTPATGLSWGWAAVPLVLALALAAWLLRRRRTRGSIPAPRSTPLERLAALEARDLSAASEPGFAAELHVELTQLVREFFDRKPGSTHAGGTRASLTDDEWLAAAALEFSEEQRVALHALFLESREIKYGGATPTHWALQESLVAARAVLTGPTETRMALAEAPA